MGQYHTVYNIDKKEKIEGFSGFKLLEQVGYPKSTSTALFLLVANSNGRGGGDACAWGGDAEEHPLVGSWAGDRIVVQGDYAEEGDQAFIADTDSYNDITENVWDLINTSLVYF